MFPPSSSTSIEIWGGEVKRKYARLTKYRFVTTLKTDSSKTNAEVYLIRSYDHIKPTSPGQSRQTTRRTTTLGSYSSTLRTNDLTAPAGSQGRRGRQRRNINHEKAQDFDIWQVARAATAAPHYFEPLIIPTSKPAESLCFEDGGFNYTNNPTGEGVREIEEAKGHDAIGVVVSIGTARADMSHSKRALFPIILWVKEIVQRFTSPETIHEETEHSAKRWGFPYYRLNSPNSLQVELDEWEPKRSRMGAPSGSITIKTITDVFNTWANHWKTREMFDQCATELVACRKARLGDEAKWERYARGSVFICAIRGCSMEGQEYYNRDNFRKHLIQDHELEQAGLDDKIRECSSFWEYPACDRTWTAAPVICGDLRDKRGEDVFVNMMIGDTQR